MRTRKDGPAPSPSPFRDPRLQALLRALQGRFRGVYPGIPGQPKGPVSIMTAYLPERGPAGFALTVLDADRDEQGLAEAFAEAERDRIFGVDAPAVSVTFRYPRPGTRGRVL